MTVDPVDTGLVGAVETVPSDFNSTSVDLLWVVAPVCAGVVIILLLVLVVVIAR